MYYNYIHFAIPVFFLFIVGEVIISFIKKYEYYDLHDSVNNLSCGTFQQVIELFVKSFMIAAYIYLYENFKLLEISYKSIIAWVVCFLLVDLCYYTFHRASHRVNIIWTSHATHHQSEEYNFTVALRQGTFERFFSWLFWLPLSIIGFPPLMYFACQQFDEIYQFFSHTKAVKKLGFLEKFMNTPSHHRVHHGKNPKYIDKNYGGTLIIWDKMFGTFQEEEEEVIYGTVTPLNSWNPFWANTKPIVDIIKKSAGQEKFLDKLKVWFAPPGWNSDGTESAIPEIDMLTYQKYRTKVPKSFTFYILFQFVLILILSTNYLDYSVNMFLSQKLLLGFMVLLSFTSISGLMENKKWSVYTEILRFAMIIPVTMYLNIDSMFKAIIISLHLISFLWLLIINSKNRKDNIDMSLVSK